MNFELREPAVVYGKNKITEEEYLQMERQSEERHEFSRGKYSGCMAMGNCLPCQEPGITTMKFSQTCLENLSHS